MSDYFDRVERQIVRNVEAGLPGASRRGLGYLATAVAVAVVIVVAGVFLLAGGSNRSAPATTPPAHNVTVTFKATAISPSAPALSPAAIDRSIVILRDRLASALPGVAVSRAGDEIIVAAPNRGADTRGRILALAVPGQLVFYDWEADAITPNGRTVASQLKRQNPTALDMSQGNGSLAPGETGAGCVPLRQAEKLASTRAQHAKYVVLQAADPSGYRPANSIDPTAGFYVLKDIPLLTGTDITHPQQGTDASGQPSVSFGFTSSGATAFRAMTRSIARRGDLVSAPAGERLNQHFAIALDNRLINVPYIDFTEYPDGISGDNGADISGGLTVQSARDLATILRYGPLPVGLTATG